MIAYLDVLDEMLREGLEGLGAALRQAQLDYVLVRQDAGGGFAGRRGHADLYYTEFALRLLTLLNGPAEAFERTLPFLSSHLPPREPTDVFSLLNSRRLLVARDIELKVDTAACLDEIDGRRSRAGGYGRPDGTGPTAYATFLVALSLGLLGEDFPGPDVATAAMAALQQADGGFAQELPGTSQTNSTAAAIAFLTMMNALSADQAGAAIAFLVARQTVSGGFAAHTGEQGADLLSTFTALSTLASMDGLRDVDVPALARFTRSCADADGGFAGSPDDPETDVEYTYYGLGTLAMLAGMTPS